MPSSIFAPPQAPAVARPWITRIDNPKIRRPRGTFTSQAEAVSIVSSWFSMTHASGSLWRACSLRHRHIEFMAVASRIVPSIREPIWALRSRG
jgi:hypothetical protein